MLPPPGMVATVTPWQLICFFLLGAATSIVTFLRGTLLPFRALYDIKTELRANPNGPCAPKQLRPSFYMTFAIGMALIACAAGQFLRRHSGLEAALPEVFFAAGIGWTIGAFLLWGRLNLRSRNEWSVWTILVLGSVAALAFELSVAAPWFKVLLAVSLLPSIFVLLAAIGDVIAVALHVKPDKMPELKRETFTA
jgi:hypothetical protein